MSLTVDASVWIAVADATDKFHQSSRDLLKPQCRGLGLALLLQATILHLLGLDHEKLTYNYAGRDFRLTDVKGNAVKEIMA